MNARRLWLSISLLSTCLLAGLLGGCGDDNEPLSNDNPGVNNLGVVVAFGDSITQGSECRCAPYPARLSAVIGKIVYNTGVGGSEAQSNVGRTKTAINKYHPAYMLILYGINDVIMGRNVNSILGALGQMVNICKQNNVVPVLATYPVPIAGHRLFAYNTIMLNNGIRTIASANGIRCVDLESEFASGSDSTNPNWITSNPLLYQPDGLHPNDAGTQIIAMAFADEF